jgi:putative spermidine/putrescine transport system substrate-binding protein/spermidine/putrescine transport system substrate-binding protein
MAASSVTAIVVSMASSVSAACTEINILSWEGYVDDAWVVPFEEATGIEVNRTYVGSNDEYMAKLAAGGTEYDIVTIVSSLAERAIGAGFVKPLDESELPHLEQVFAGFRDLDFIRKDGELYGVPTYWGTQPVTVNADVIPEGNDFGILFDPQYSGRIGMWQDVTTIADVASYMGFENLWTLSEEELEVVKQKMIEQKPLVRTYWSQAGEAIELFASGEIVASNSWNYITEALRAEGMNVREFVPETPLGWVDSNFVVADSECPTEAHAFIDYLISPEPQAVIGETSGYTVTNPQSREFMDAEVWERLYMDEGPDILDRIEFWQDIPRRGRYLEILNEVKAARQ